MAFSPPFQRVFPATFDRRATVAAAAPYSLYFDGANDIVDCGTPASLDDLAAGDMTVDVYWQATTASIPAGPCHLFGQIGAALTSGWLVYFSNAAGGAMYLFVVNGAGSFVQTAKLFTWSQNAWYYVRARRASNTLYVSVNTVTQPTPQAIVGYTGNNLSITHGASADLSRDFTGRICYVHAWNTNKGDLATVPSSPFVVDANTVGRWIYSNGSGTTLTDTSGNSNHGTISGATWSGTVPAGWTI